MMGEGRAYYEGELLAGQAAMERAGRDLRCPACGEPLTTRALRDHDSIEVDLCELCGGLWLDEGELADLQREPAEQLVADLAAARARVL